MPRRKDPRTLEFARLALRQFRDNNPNQPADCAFFAGFALALGYVRLVGVPTPTEQEAVSAEAVKLSAPATPREEVVS